MERALLGTFRFSVREFEQNWFLAFKRYCIFKTVVTMMVLVFCLVFSRMSADYLFDLQGFFFFVFVIFLGISHGMIFCLFVSGYKSNELDKRNQKYLRYHTCQLLVVRHTAVLTVGRGDVKEISHDSS